jgi:hypothetical protein
MAVKTFTTGEVLTASDTNTYLNNGGLVYVSGGTFTNVTTADITGFTTTYKYYRVIIAPYRHSGSGAAIVTATLRTSSGAATGNYYGAGWFVNYLGTSGAYATRNNAADIVLTTVLDNIRMSKTYVEIGNLNATGFYPSVTGQFYDFANAQNTTFGYELANSGNVIDRIRIACAVGITGDWRVYGYREP